LAGHFQEWPMFDRLQGYIAFLVENSIFLIVGTLAGLIWANINLSGYESVAHYFHFAVNDIGMSFFFGIAAKEVFEAVLPGGALASPRKAAVPLLATLGGMILPALIFVCGALASGHRELVRGWAIPCATDIAFSYLVARLVFGANHPAIPFLLILAIADDGLGLLILALFYPTGTVHLVTFAGLVAAAVILALVMKRRGVTSFWPYILVCGSMSWSGFYIGGFHPALALVPVIFAMPHAQSDIGVFAEEKGSLTDALNQFEHRFEAPVAVILGLFGLTNAGVAFSSVGPGTWLVLAGLLVGKPLGIFLFSLGGKLLKLTLPEGMRWADVLVLGCAAGIGFTVALFVSTVAFEPGEHLVAVKMGSLMSLSGALVTILIAKVLKVSAVR
jgi:Na+:H+ antiporter, NhaA family